MLHLEWLRGHISYLFYCQNIAMTVNPALQYMAPAIFLGHFWSLAVEEQYYMFWPLAIWILRDERKIMRLCQVLTACIVLLRFGLIYLVPSNMMVDLIYKELPTHGDGLLLGSCLVLALRRWPVEALLRHMQGLVYLLLWCLSTVAVAMLSYKYLESPFLRLKERFAPSEVDTGRFSRPIRMESSTGAD